MTEKSKRILEGLLREHSFRHEINLFTNTVAVEWNHHQDEICDFLNSIPEIESHLCKGGYIQDKNGTPCCDGDEVNFQFGEGFYNGILKFDHKFKHFTIVNENGDYPWIKDGIKWFEKVKE